METEVVIVEEFEPIQEFKFTKPKTQKTSNCQCVYGIFIRDRLVYIGYTWSGFKTRIDWHEGEVAKEDKDTLNMKELYKALRENKGEYSYKILYKCPDELGEYGLQMIEKLLIETLHPKFNKAGVTVPYQFRGTTRRPKALYIGQEEDSEDIY